MPEIVYRIWTSVWTRFFAFCSKVELPRKIWHAGSISLAAWISTFLHDFYLRVGIVFVALLLSIGFEWLRKRVSVPFVDYLQRESEIKGQRTTMVDFIAALLLGAMFFPPEALVTALLVTAWCDPGAAFVGQAMKDPTKWRGSRKSMEGTLACFAVAVAVVVIRDPRCALWVPLTVGFVAALAELKTKQQVIRTGRCAGHLSLADNFWITVSTGTVLSIAELISTTTGPVT